MLEPVMKSTINQSKLTTYGGNTTADDTRVSVKQNSMMKSNIDSIDNHLQNESISEADMKKHNHTDDRRLALHQQISSNMYPAFKSTHQSQHDNFDARTNHSKIKHGDYFVDVNYE